MLLDEATSALDEVSQQKVYKALKNVMKNRTAIVVAHRLDTIKECDRVCVLEGGVIVQSNSYEALEQEKEGCFAQLIKKKSNQEVAEQ